MPKVSPLQSNFLGGEISPLLFGRVDIERYAQSLAVCKNYIPMLQGGLIRRTGSYYVAPAKEFEEMYYPGPSVRLIPFKFNTEQAYIIEVGMGYMRFYRDNFQIQTLQEVITGDVETGMNSEMKMLPYEIEAPYAPHELWEIKTTQSADVLYLFHPSHAPRKLSRLAHTEWKLEEINFLDGPYIKQNEGAATLAPSAVSGNGITITASVATFKSSDVGRLVRMRHSATWGWAKITQYVSPTSVKADVKSNFGATTAVTIWRLGLWYSGNYPATGTFHEDRLWLAGTKNAPQRIDASRSSDYENFQPTTYDNGGLTQDDMAISITLNAEDVNTIRWMTSDEKGLQVGTFGNEFMVKPASNGAPLSATNISAKPTSAHGSANVQPVRAGKASIFVQTAGRKLRDLQYFYEVDGYRASDLTLLSEHITSGGIIQMAYQKEPQQIVWCVRGDGALIGMTFEKEGNDNVQIGWHRHELGGYGDPSKGFAKVESVAVIPSPDGSRDEVWIVVKRWINGKIVRYIEYINKPFEDKDHQRDAFFIDSGLTYDVPIELEGIDLSVTPVHVATVGAHNLQDGDKIRFFDMVGANELDGKTYVVTPDPQWDYVLTLRDEAGNPVSGEGITPYVSGGAIRKLVTNIAGLEHLEGETVSILADGAVVPNQKVVNGSIVLPLPSTVAHIGLGYQSDAKMLRLEAGAADGTALGKTRRIHAVSFLLHRSLGLKIGTSFDDLHDLNFRFGSDPLSSPPKLFSGIYYDTITANYDTENQICWRQDQPLPSTILAVAPQMVTQDRG